MKNIFILFSMITVIAACNPSATPPKFYGQSFDTTNVITVSELVSQMQGQSKVDAVVAGQVTESCQAEGCWLNLKNESGGEMFVDWDHQFNLPKNISGQKVFISGYAYIDTIKPEKPVAFKATGVHL